MTAQARPRIAILANCTHTALTRTLRRHDPALDIISFPVFAMTPAQLQDTADRLDGVDHILTLVHGDRFGPLATAALRARHGPKVTAVPVPFFAGQHPDMSYVVAAGRRIGQEGGPLGDYSSAVVLRDLQRGLTEAQTVDRYVSGESIAELDIRRLWDQGLDRLRQTEAGQGTEIAVSDLVAAAARGGQPFLTFNHPTAPLIAAICSRFLTRVQDRPVTVAPLSEADHPLTTGAFWPVRDTVKAALGLNFPSEQRFKTQQDRDGQWMDVATFAAESYRAFKRTEAPEALRVITPDYLAAQIGAAQTGDAQA